jgi:hypothetical protein
MVGMRTRRSFLLGLVGVSVVPLAGCYVEGSVPVYAEGYDPQYYDGYVVYYDDVGRPYYYANGGVVWVSPGSPFYPRLVGHWRSYHPAYRRWYARHGYRYRGYRRR